MGGFGADSAIELSAALAAQWRLRSDLDTVRRERLERVTLAFIGREADVTLRVPVGDRWPEWR